MIETVATGGAVAILVSVTGYMIKKWTDKVDVRFDKLSIDMKEATKNMRDTFRETCLERQHTCASHIESKVEDLKSTVKWIHEDRHARWNKQADINEAIKVHITINGKKKDSNSK